MPKKSIVAGLILSVAASAILITVPAFAEGFGNRGMGEGHERPSFDTLDTDGDGKVSVAEMRAHRIAEFAEMDSDGDGSLSADEMSAIAASRAAERSSAMISRMIEWKDSDGDGKLSETEMGGKNDRNMFARLDADEDGSISKDEYDNFERGGRGGRGKHGGDRAQGKGGMGMGKGGHGKGGHSHSGGWRNNG